LLAICAKALFQVTVFAAIAAAMSSGQIASDQRSEATADGALYLFNPDGEFQQVATGKYIAGRHWTVARMEGVISRTAAAKCQDFENSGCPWKLLDIDYQPLVRRFYALAETQPTNKGQKTSYEFLAFFPDMRKQLAISVPAPAEMKPLMWISADGRRLRILREEAASTKSEAASAEQYTLVVETYTTDRSWDAFQKQTTVSSSWQLPQEGARHLADHGYFGPDGARVFDGLEKIEIGAKDLTKKVINPVDGMSADQRKKLADFASLPDAGVEGQLRLLDTYEGRFLMGISNPSKEKLAAFTWDGNSGTTQVFEVPSGELRFLPEQERVLWQDGNKGTEFAVFDSRTGERVLQVNGSLGDYRSARYVRICGGHGVLAYAADSHVALLELKPDSKAVSLDTTLLLNEQTKCIAGQE
jgi:hypothetical protein